MRSLWYEKRKANDLTLLINYAVRTWLSYSVVSSCDTSLRCTSVYAKSLFNHRRVKLQTLLHCNKVWSFSCQEMLQLSKTRNFFFSSFRWFHIVNSEVFDSHCRVFNSVDIKIINHCHISLSTRRTEDIANIKPRHGCSAFKKCRLSNHFVYASCCSSELRRQMFTWGVLFR